MAAVTIPAELPTQPVDLSSWSELVEGVFLMHKAPAGPDVVCSPEIPEDIRTTILNQMRLLQTVLFDVRCPTYSLNVQCRNRGKPITSADGVFAGIISIKVPDFCGKLPFRSISSAFVKLLWAFSENQHAGHIEVARATNVLSRLLEQLQRQLGIHETSLPFIFNELCLRNIPFNRIGPSLYLIAQDERFRYFMGSAGDQDTVTGATIAQNKLITTRLLNYAGLPAPKSIPVNSLNEAKAAAESLGYPVAVKPVDLERSAGVSSKVQDTVELEVAFNYAASSRRGILVENHIPGECVRLVAIGGAFVFGFIRYPVSLIGDGVTNLETLFATAIKRDQLIAPHKKKSRHPTYSEFEAALVRDGLAPGYVLRVGDRFSLLEGLPAERGTTTDDVTTLVHADNRWLVERISRLVGLATCGIDLITTDISKSWRETGAAVCEINFKPQIGKISAKFYVDQLLG